MRAFTIIAMVSLVASCATRSTLSKTENEVEQFLKEDAAASEVFRVVMMSDNYRVAQMKNQDTIRRMKDPGGDSFIAEELIKLDKIDEIREGMVKLWLYPTSGKVMKVRPFVLTNLLEIDKLLVDDIQRWNFEFPRGSVMPQSFFIRYKVVLRKKQSDAAIIDEIRKDMKDKRTWR